MSRVQYSDDVQISQHLIYFKTRATALLLRGACICQENEGMCHQPISFWNTISHSLSLQRNKKLISKISSCVLECSCIVCHNHNWKNFLKCSVFVWSNKIISPEWFSSCLYSCFPRSSKLSISTFTISMKPNCIHFIIVQSFVKRWGPTSKKPYKRLWHRIH